MQKLKQKLLKFAALGTSLAVLLITVAQPAAAETWLQKIGTAVKELLIDMLITIVTAFATAVTTVIGAFLQIAIKSQDLLIQSDTMKLVWDSMLTIANSLFLLALIIASIAIITRVNVNNYNLKKTLTGLALAIALSNLSLLVVRALIEFTGALTEAIVNLLTKGSGIKGAGISTLVQTILDVVTPATHQNMEIEGLIASLIVIILVGWVMWKLALILIERVIWLFALAIIAPLAFAVSLLPTMQDYTKEWWSHLMKWLLVLPVTFGLTVIAILIMNGGGNIDEASFQAKLEGFKQISTKDLTGKRTVTPEFIIFIAGLGVLWMASEAGKKLKVGGPLSSGTAYKMAADTFTGKNAVGKFGKARYYEDVYPQLMKNKTFAKYEGKRQAATSGIVGNVFNRKGVVAKKKADAEITAHETTAAAAAETVIKLGKQARTKKTALDTRYGQWLDAEGKVKDTAPRNVKKAYEQYQENEEDKYKSALGGLRKFHIKNVNKDYTAATVPTYDELKSKYEKAMRERKYGKANAALDLMKTLSRAHNIRPEEANKAKEFLNSDEIQSDIANKLYLDENEFKSIKKPEEQLRRARAQTAQIADVELMRANAAIAQIKPNLKTELTNAGLDPNLTDLPPDEATKKIDVALKIDTAFNAAGLTGSISDDHFKNIIAAQTAGATGTPAELEAWLKANWVTLAGTTGLLPSAADITEYDDINTALKSAGASGDVGAIKNYQNLHRATAPTGTAHGQSIHDVLQRIQSIQTRFNKQQVIKEQADAAIKNDNQTDPDAYNLIVHQKINYYTAGGQSTVAAKTSMQNEITNAKSITMNALNTTFTSNDLVTKLPNGQDLQDKLKDLGMPVMANQTIGEAHAQLRRLENSLENLSK